MRLSHSVAAAVVTLGAVGALGAACGSDTDPLCARSFLRYDNFGAPFLSNWCRDCHSAGLPADMRQQAPAGIDFDSLTEVRRWLRQIDLTAGQGSSMPPAGGPSVAERDMLVEWLGCGAR
jgi:uncharacterized membrane protein